jgi:hypothetical protein
MPETFKPADALDFLGRLSLPLRIAIWLIVTAVALVLTFYLNYPEKPPLPIRICLIVAGSLILLLIVLCTGRPNGTGICRRATPSYVDPSHTCRKERN